MAGINGSLAVIFYEIADIHELLNEGLPWKPIAYRKAARAIEGLPEEADRIYARGGLKALKEIPGVGEARRGWAQKKDVVNTFQLAKLRKRFERIKV